MRFHHVGFCWHYISLRIWTCRRASCTIRIHLSVREYHLRLLSVRTVPVECSMPGLHGLNETWIQGRANRVKLQGQFVIPRYIEL